MKLFCLNCGERYEASRSDRKLCDDCRKSRKRSGNNWNKSNPLFERPFCAWDGEGVNKKPPLYTLLQSSEGAYLHNDAGLSTEECLHFLTDQPQEWNHVWFAFGYDVNMILGNLNWKQLAQLCGEKNRTYYRDYVIEYIPRKQFRVWRDSDRTKKFLAWDVWGFFQSSFIKAVDKWIPNGVSDVIREGKAGRVDFSTWPLEKIAEYNAEECKLIVQLMEALREAIKGAGWRVERWDGPGALATHFFQRHNTKGHIAEPDNERLRDASERAYFGGRIDAGGWGRVDNVFHYDIISAYPSAMRECPSLAGVTWKTSPSDDPFQLLHISWKVSTKTQWGPFPFRNKRGAILYPPSGEGWYWMPEIEAARRRFGRRIQIRTIERFSCNASEYPLREPIQEAYAYRAQLKAAGDPANVPIKLALNSLYGKTAQSVSYNKDKPPPYRCLLWAGYLTAKTRAVMQDAMAASDPLLVMTDGLYTREPLPPSMIGTDLGDWEGGECKTLDVIRAGVYKYGEDTFSRGYEIGNLSVPDIIEKFERDEATIPIKIRRLIGMRMAVRNNQRLHWRRFIEKPLDMKHPAHVGIKRQPFNYFARRQMGTLGENGYPGPIDWKADGPWHVLSPRALDGKYDDGISEPYKRAQILPKSNALDFWEDFDETAE